MADVQEPRNALWRRDEQLQRWNQSDTNKVTAEPKKQELIKVKFQDGCVFLAACSSCDKDEVKRLLARGADINTANIDGLTALHQACIDNNLEMVEFLVELGAEIDACDNEGWTPLHATASCDFIDIAKFLIEQGANVGAVNNDGELPCDIADSDEMEQLLLDEMELKGVDADAAREEEEQAMLRDANSWLALKRVEELPHPKTGATALHVAAAKGYCKVMSILIEASVNIDAKDHDGWTALHAAAHWGQEEACKILVENLCNMDETNSAGQTAFDIAEPNLVPFLEELKRKQATLKKDHEAKMQQNIGPRPAPLKRRSSVTRMSVDQKQNVILKNVEEERQHMEAMRQQQLNEFEEKIYDSRSSSQSSSTEESDESETEKQNKINREQPSPPSNKGEIDEPADLPKESPKIEETKSPPDKLQQHSPRIKDLAMAEELQREADKENEKKCNIQPDKEKGPSMKDEEEHDKNDLHKADIKQDLGKPQDEDIPHHRTASSSGAGDSQETRNRFNEFYSRYASLVTSNKSNTNLPSSSSGVTTAASSAPVVFQSSYVPLSRRRQLDQEENEKRKQKEQLGNSVASTTSNTSLTNSNTIRRSFEPPKRDEERETERKAKARRARETRRSTQGVTKEDLEMAEKTLIAASKGSEPPVEDKSDKENKPEDYSLIRRRAWDDKKEEDKNSSRKLRDSGLSSDTSYNKSDKEKKEEREDPSQKSSAIRTRRKRENRRPTGKITLEDIQGVSEDGEKKKDDKQEENSISSSRYPSSRYSDPLSSSSSVYDRTSSSSYHSRDRPNSYSSYSRSYTSTSLPEKESDYKKLYEKEKEENEKLRKDFKKLQQELSDMKIENEKYRLKNESSRSVESTSDKRERRALERKLSELEEELKAMENLKADNQRLKEENGALIRVISKLSK